MNPFGHCLDCCYWDCFSHKNDGSGSGECRRFAPRPRVSDVPQTSGEENVVWPITRGNEGCGDFGEKSPKIEDESPNALLKIEEVCSLLGISKRSAARLAAAGDIKTVKIGRSLRFQVDAVNEYISVMAEANRLAVRRRVGKHRTKKKFEMAAGALLRLGSDE